MALLTPTVELVGGASSVTEEAKYSSINQVVSYKRGEGFFFAYLIFSFCVVFYYFKPRVSAQVEHI